MDPVANAHEWQARQETRSPSPLLGRNGAQVVDDPLPGEARKHALATRTAESAGERRIGKQVSHRIGRRLGISRSHQHTSLSVGNRIGDPATGASTPLIF